MSSFFWYNDIDILNKQEENMKKKIFTSILALSMFLVPTARADELTDPYIPRIRSREIKPPQYYDNKISGPNPSIDEWIESVENQGGGKLMEQLNGKGLKKNLRLKNLTKTRDL